MGKTAVLTCDHPRCRATVEAPRYLDVAPDGWWRSRDCIRQIYACPKHAPIARAAEEALHDWAGRETEARNAWIDQNPPPKLPAWLRRIG